MSLELLSELQPLSLLESLEDEELSPEQSVLLESDSLVLEVSEEQLLSSRWSS